MIRDFVLNQNVRFTLIGDDYIPNASLIIICAEIL